MKGILIKRSKVTQTASDLCPYISIIKHAYSILTSTFRYIMTPCRFIWIISQNALYFRLAADPQSFGAHKRQSATKMKCARYYSCGLGRGAWVLTVPGICCNQKRNKSPLRYQVTENRFPDMKIKYGNR